LNIVLFIKQNQFDRGVWRRCGQAGRVCIPGATRLANLKSNLASAELSLTETQARRLDALASKVLGERYDKQGMARLNG
jgi:diketogulonate reductase-like aldo/keto reductase